MEDGIIDIQNEWGLCDDDNEVGEFYEFVGHTLDDDRQTDEWESFVWAVTISPPLHNYSDGCKVDIYGDLRAFSEYINNGQLEVYPEFADNGRLHYHCLFHPSKRNFAIDYLFWVSKQGINVYEFVLRIITGYTKTGKPKTRKYKRCPTRRFMLKLKTNDITSDGWLEYCRKGSEFTKKILGFDKIDCFVYSDIKNYLKKKYLLDVR